MLVGVEDEELRGDLVKINLSGRNGSGIKVKEDEDNATLTLKGQHKLKKNKDISKVKCLHYS